jgi:hypothetical protein
MGDPIVLPAGARLVHIGPHKTGTTALQRALHRSRDALHEQGVHYAHPSVQAYRPAIGLTGLRGRRGGPVADPADWTALVEEVRAAGEMRVVVSSESLSNARTPQIEKLREDLGPDRVHVVRMVRRYDLLAPSQWQQQLHNGRRTSLARFCARLLEPDSLFWRRHGFADLTRRWADVVGPENVSVVVVDENDRRWLLDVFEQMLSLREGTLPLPEGRPNRSLSLAEAETLRRVNAGIAKAGWSDRVIHRYVREGVSVGFKRVPTDPESGKAQLPRDLHDLLRATTERDVADLLGLGVHVVGDVGLLTVPPWQGADPGAVVEARVTLSAAAVAAATVAVAQKAEEPVPLGGSAAAPAPERRTSRLLRLPVQKVTHLSPEGPAGAFARDAGGPRLVEPGHGRAKRVLVTVVPPWQLLAGRWQDHLTGRGELPYAAWLRQHPEAWDVPDHLAEAVDLVGPGRVVVAVGDARFPGSWASATAAVRGEAAAGPVRRSLLTWAEAEWLREFNTASVQREVPDGSWRRHLLEGALPWVLSRVPGSDAGAHPLDGELRTRVEALGGELRSAVERAGVEVVGDVGALSGFEPAPAPARLTPRLASWPILGIIAASDVPG